MRPAVALAVALAVCLVPAASPALAAPKVWTQDWEIANHPTVHVRVDDARVRVHAGPTGRIATRVEYELKRVGLVFGAHTPTVVFERKGDEMWIHARDPRGVGVVGGIHETFTVDVTVPANVTLTVRSTDGAIECEPMTGKFQFETIDGAVRATGLRGEVDAITGDGRVTLEDLAGRVHVRTRDGRVEADGRFDAVDVVSRDGSVALSARAGSKVESSWLVESNDGRVDVRIPHDLAALLDVRSRDGRLRIDLPIPTSTDRRAKTLIGELNGGGPPLRIRTKDGGITLALSD